MKFVSKFLIACTLLAFPQVSRAQAVSAADISAMVDKRMAAFDEYAELLDDPDPARSLAAMQIMIGLDDSLVSRMALQHGLTSTSAPVRKAALKSYFDSGPILNIFIDGSSLDRDSLTSYVNQRSGTVDSKGMAFLSYKVGAFDDKNGCYDFHSNANYCLITLSESNTAIGLWGRWTPLNLSSEGELVGMVQVDRMTPSVPVRIPVRP